ncbi:MAG: hypothetical protein GXP43_00915 [bacterium]|nr:hypothetical protein [bacterium]
MVTLKIPPFATFRDIKLWEDFIQKKLAVFEKNIADYLKYWYIESRNNHHAYPSQGMLLTPFDFLPVVQTGMIPPEEMIQILRVRQYFLEIFNHPERLEFLKRKQQQKFNPPPKIKSRALTKALKDGVALSVSDLGVAVVGSQNQRISRKQRLLQGPFVKLGRFARSPLVGSAMPDVYGSVYAVSTMAQCLSFVGVPRNGPFHKIQRQVDLVKEVWNALENSEVLVGRSDSDRQFLLKQWRSNVVGVLEAETDKALKRAEALYNAGVRTFRVYSPEPGINALSTVKALRQEIGDGIEIFVGQVVDIIQAKQLEQAGADGLYIGIGGGGRCITGVRSGSVIDWPMLLWQLRGEINIPVIVEGGASDHIATTLALGATGIGVSRIAAGGTIESPGGMLYCIDEHGRYFKPYGGEASARSKYLDKKMLPFNTPSFVEGETRVAEMNHLPYGVPTIPFNLFSLTEDIILSLVFRGVTEIDQLQHLDPSPLRLKTSAGDRIQNTH